MSVEALPSQLLAPASLHSVSTSDTRPDRTPASEPRTLSAQPLRISPTSSRASSPGQPAAVAALLSMNDERTRTSPRVPEPEQQPDVTQARRGAGQSSSSSARRASVSSAINVSNPRPPSGESSPLQRDSAPVVVEHESQPRGSWPAAAPTVPRTKSSSAAAKRQTADNDHQHHHHQQPSLQSQSWVTQNGQAPPRRRGRPPAMPSNGYERVLSPIPASHHTQNAPAQHNQHQMASHSSHGSTAPGGGGGSGNDNIQAVRMALDAVSRESARAGALQAQLDRALADVANLKQREQQMMREFDHRVDRAVKFHKQQLEAKVAAQQARNAQFEGRLHLADGMHESSTLIEDDSIASTTASPDVEIDLRMKKHGSGPILRPVHYDLPENRRGSTASVDFDGHTPPPQQQQLSRLRTDNHSPEHARYRSVSGGQHSRGLARSSREYDGAPESTTQKRMADDDTASERSAKRARTSDASPNAVHVQTHPQYASPPKYDAQRVRLIYESDSKGNHVCRVCTLHSTDGQTVGFPVGTPDVDLVLHGMGAHPALWNSPLNNDAVTSSPRGK